MKPEKIEQLLLTAIRWGMTALLFTPLIVGLHSMIFPFIFGKVIFMQIVIEVIIALYALLCLVSPRFRPAKSPVNIAIFIFLAVLVVASFAGVDTSRSFWSNFERMSGVITFIHFGLLALVFEAIMTEAKEIESFWRKALFINLLPLAAGIWQKIDPTFLLFSGGRIYGTFGNPIYLGSYAGFHLFWAAYFFLKTPKPLMKIIYALIAGLDLLVFVWATSRSAMAGLIAGIITIGFLWSLRMYRMRKKAVVAVWIVIAALLIVPFLFRDQSFIKNSPYFSRFTNFSFVTGTGSTRLIAWKVAWTGFKERPLLGWGPENFFYVFNQHYNPVSLEFGTYETWFDHAHNTLLDLLVTTGAIGLLAYLALYIVATLFAWRVGHRAPEQVMLTVFLIGILANHFATNIFVFDHPTSYLLIFFVLGSIAALIRAQKKNSAIAPEAGRALKSWQAILVVLMAVFFIYNINIPALRENLLDLKSENELPTSAGLTIAGFKKALAINGPYTHDVRMNLGRTVQSIQPSPEIIKSPLYRDLWQLAVDNLEKELSQKPRNVLGAIMLGQIYTVGGSWDPANYDHAEKAFARAAKFSPKRQQIYYAWSKLALERGDVAAAEEYIRQTIKDNPNVNQGWWYLFAILMSEQRDREALPAFEEAVKRGYPPSLSEQVMAAGAYNRLGRYEEALGLMLSVADAGGRTKDLYQSIADLYDRLGKKDEALKWRTEANRI
ncbi:MAG: hypothetical protein HW383_608 [Candidatus Magasanikbacteria bacterium]|nr:hypothetical protein [Candidatus Magasanikbacteria bacterium]